jgi:uncharacterized membrane protein
MGGAALVIAGSVPPERGSRRAAVTTQIRLGGIFFAVPLVVFGAQHLMYGPFVAHLIPSWIPARLFWAYFVGIAFIASALSIIARRSAALAANLLGLMFMLFVLLVHAPRVAAASHNGNEWTSAFVALAMSGGAFAVAGRL